MRVIIPSFEVLLSLCSVYIHYGRVPRPLYGAHWNTTWWASISFSPSMHLRYTGSKSKQSLTLCFLGFRALHQSIMKHSYRDLKHGNDWGDVQRTMDRKTYPAAKHIYRLYLWSAAWDVVFVCVLCIQHPQVCHDKYIYIHSLRTTGAYWFVVTCFIYNLRQSLCL